MNALYVFLVVTVIMSLFQLVVCMWEKRLTWPYGGLQGGPTFDAGSAYAHRTLAAAIENGFMHLGWAPDTKGEKYQMNYCFLLSPDRQALLIIGAGKILGMELRGVTFYSPADDGLRLWYSTDNQSAIEFDISRLWMSHLVFAHKFADIWRSHQSWMQSAKFSRHTFNPGCALAEFRRLREQRFNEMLRRGYISYTDSTQTFWRYTLQGAVKLVFFNYGTGLIRAVTLGRFPKTA